MTWQHSMRRGGQIPWLPCRSRQFVLPTRRPCRRRPCRRRRCRCRRHRRHAATIRVSYALKLLTDLQQPQPLYSPPMERPLQRTAHLPWVQTAQSQRLKFSMSRRCLLHTAVRQRPRLMMASMHHSSHRLLSRWAVHACPLQRRWRLCAHRDQSRAHCHPSLSTSSQLIWMRVTRTARQVARRRPIAPPSLMRHVWRIRQLCSLQHGSHQCSRACPLQHQMDPSCTIGSSSRQMRAADMMTVCPLALQ